MTKAAGLRSGTDGDARCYPVRFMQLPSPSLDHGPGVALHLPWSLLTLVVA